MRGKKRRQIMPDFSQLTAQIISALTLTLPYLDNVAQGIGEEFGSTAVRKAGQLIAVIRNRFHQDNNQRAEQTLDLFRQDPKTFESALSKMLLQSLEQHPEWAKEVKQLLIDDSVQEIIAANHSVVERITMNLAGPGTQSIQSDNSWISDVDISKKDS